MNFWNNRLFDWKFYLRFVVYFFWFLMVLFLLFLSINLLERHIYKYKLCIWNHGQVLTFSKKGNDLLRISSPDIDELIFSKKSYQTSELSDCQLNSWQQSKNVEPLNLLNFKSSSNSQSNQIPQPQIL